MFALLVASVLPSTCGVVSTPPLSDLKAHLVDSVELPRDVRGRQDPVAVNWQLAANAETDSHPHCGEWPVVGRSWTDNGIRWNRPEVLQFVCGTPSDEAAAYLFASTSLASTAGEDYPNFDLGIGKVFSLIVNRGLRTLAASDADAGCAEGNADGLCYVWIYRGRYGAYLVQVLFRGDSYGGGLGARSFLDLIQSFDSALARRLQSY